MCYNIDGEIFADEAPELMPPNQSLCSCMNYLWDKAAHLQVW